ncbi:MAG: hypothetical protein P8R54_17460 [Myxococcota bacterium]|nr:hypothetical protein [Myxococcota bacterium]
MRCRKCGHRWSRVLEGSIAFELQRTEGDQVIGPLVRSQIREMLYSGTLTGRERVRLPGSEGGWKPLAACEELSEILVLLDIQIPREHRIQGWQSQPTRPEPTAPVVAAESESSGRPVGLIVGGVVVLIVAVIAALMLQ